MPVVRAGPILQGIFDVLRLIGKLFLGNEIGGTGKATRRDKGLSRKDRKESGVNEQAQQRREEIMGFAVVGLLMLLALAGIWATANPSVPALPGGEGSKGRR